ncbi:craniofacial development protein 1 [Pristis pectinata]|uniref:craniofacial development protein 1 n=1 Tax=Pristis pectinata TaxID=685728 RepID=UPI00223E66D3|nr:craniofacial development protein 1 [Pristis pectinata]
MSDSDSENYSSEEDADYEPSDEDYSEDDVSELVKENLLEGNDEQPREKKSVKKTGKRVSSRNREALSLEREDEGKGEDDQAVDPEECAQVEKKKADDLWASFLSDVGEKAKPKATIPSSKKEETLVVEEKSTKHQDLVKDAEKLKSPGKVTITKVFDFAGEEVKVTKEVDAASKEAKNFLQKQNNVEEKCSSTTPVSVATGAPTGSGIKRQSGLSNILGKIGGKKQKLSTLEKSKIDWEAFKETEGIGDELAIYNRGKEGYIERKAFLDRVDHRQFELERDIRLSNMKP